MNTERSRRTRASKVRRLAALASLVSVTLAAPSHAEPTAREHFASGVEASRRGDLVVALEHFEKAQALSPNQTVLFNLGQTYSALGRPVEALGALEKYIAMDGPSGDAVRRREVESLVKKNEARVGTLEVELEPPDAVLAIDGQAVSLVSGKTTRVAAGRRLLTATREGFHPTVRPLDVRPLETSRVRLVLEHPAAMPDAIIEARCKVPDVAVSVDGKVVGRSASAISVPVVSGTRRVRFERPGFVPSELDVVADAQSVARAECALAYDPSFPARERAALRVSVSDARAAIFVNGMPFRGERIPPGRHTVDVTAPGFRPWRGEVNARAGVPNEIRVTLVPTEERRRAERAQTRKIVAYSTGGVGLALLGVGTVVYVSNQSRYDEWREARDALANDLSNGQSGPDQAQQAEDLQERAASIQRTDDLAVGALVLGGALVTLAAILLVTGEDAPPEQKKQRATNPFQITF
jgi:tetratricopeptide (TPR) repeat protein